MFFVFFWQPRIKLRKKIDNVISATCSHLSSDSGWVETNAGLQICLLSELKASSHAHRNLSSSKCSSASLLIGTKPYDCIVKICWLFKIFFLLINSHTGLGLFYFLWTSMSSKSFRRCLWCHWQALLKIPVFSVLFSPSGIRRRQINAHSRELHLILGLLAFGQSVKRHLVLIGNTTIYLFVCFWFMLCYAQEILGSF